jgi:hypothetical protein
MVGPSGISAMEDSHMGTFETIAVVVAVYVLAFIAHQTTRTVDQTAPDEV